MTLCLCARLRAFRGAIGWLLGRAAIPFAIPGSTGLAWHGLAASKTDRCQSDLSDDNLGPPPFQTEAQSSNDQLVSSLFAPMGDSTLDTIRAIYPPPTDYLQIQRLSNSKKSHSQSVVDWIVYGP
jgi:hypothetical protein